MTRIAAVALAVGAVIWVRTIGTATATGSAGTALALGFALVGAWVTGDVLRRFNLPRLTGYLLFGIIVGPYIGNVITESMAGQLQVITGIATTLIALIAGLTLNLERMGRRLAAIVRMTGATLTIAMAGLAVLLWIAWPWLPVAPEATGTARLAMVALLVVIIVSFSPTMTAAVITDTGARGRLSETVLTMVVVADLVLLVLFSCAMQVARVVFKTTDGGAIDVLVRFAWEIGGAVAFGVLVGALFALYMRYVGREVTLVLLGVCTLLSQVGSTQEFEPLLAAVAAGLVIENLAVAQGDTLRTAVQRGAPPVLVVFFVAVGASLRLDALVGRRARRDRPRRDPARAHPHQPPDRPGARRARRARRQIRVDRPGLPGRHHARVRVGGGGGVSRAGARRCSCCSWDSSPSTRSSDRSRFDRGWRGRTRSTRTSHGRSWWSPTANPICTPKRATAGLWPAPRPAASPSRSMR